MKKEHAMKPITVDMVTLRLIEDRISNHMQDACMNLLQVGRCLVQAKEMDLVSHGEWENWVRQNTGMSERSAQRLMQAARSVPKGSAMERLPVSKIQAILALPEGEREGMAEKAEAEDMTVQELRKQIQQMHATAAEKSQQLTALRERLQAQAKHTGEQAEMRAAAEKRSEMLEKQLDEMNANAANEISPRAQAEIDRLRAELTEAEDYAARQSDLRQEAQAALMDFQQGRESDAQIYRRFDAGDLAMAVSSFIGSAGVICHMGAEISRMDGSTRADISLQIRRIEEWLEGARRAMQVEVLDL